MTGRDDWSLRIIENKMDDEIGTGVYVGILWSSV